MFEEGRIDIIKLGGEGAKSSGVGQSVVTNVAIVSDQLVIDGANLDGVTKVRITGPSGFDQTFAIESQSASNLVANGLSNIAFAVGSVFDLILTDAQGAATHQVTFTLQDGAVTASKLDDMGAGVGQVLKYDGTTWGPSDLGALTYAGTWDASSATVPNVSPAAGEYYIVSVAGTGIDLSDGSGSRNFAVGDWLVYNNTTSRWDKIDNATSVTSFNGRNGPITPATNDYTWAQIDKTTSPIGDLSNVNTTGAGVGSVLKFDGTNWIVGTDNTVSAGSVDSSAITDGSIVDADVNASAAIAQSKINNLTTDLAAKLNLSGGTMTGDLTMGSNNIITSGTVDGVDVSALNTTVGNNSTAIAGKQNTITTGTTAQYLRGDLSLSTFATDARSAAVLNSTAGTETDQAASVAAMKTYVSSQVSGSGSVLDGGNTTGATVVVGTNDAQSLQFETNNTPAMTILDGGNVGIGTTLPTNALHISSDDSSATDEAAVIIETMSDNAGESAINFRKSRSGAIVQSGDRLGEIIFTGYDGSDYNTIGARIRAVTSGTITANKIPTNLRFQTMDDATGTLSERMSISENGRVGIGTTAPATKLDVEGKITVGPIDATAGNTGAIALEELAANGTDSVTFRAPDSLAANYTLTMPADDGASGQVLSTDGSGVLSWAAAPAATSVSAGAGSAGTPSMSFSSDPNTGLFSGGADIISFSAGGSEIFSASSSGLVSPTTGGGSVSTANGTASAPTFSFAGDTDTGWFRPAANTLAAATAGSERVRIDASGNVGIGTTSPAYTLHVGDGSTNGFLGITEADGTNPNTLRFGGTGTGSGELAFVGVGNNERLRINSSGNVGIGTTTPTAKLEVQASASSGSGILLYDNSTSNSSPYIEIQGRRSGGNVSQSFSGGLALAGLRTDDAVPTSKRLGTIYFGGNHTDGTESNLLYPASISGIAEGTFSNSTTMPSGLAFYTGSTGRTLGIANQTYGTERMRIDSNGNVGIGTTSPTHLFSVYGGDDEDAYDNEIIARFGSKVGMNEWTGIGFGAFNESTSKTGILHERVGNFGIGKLHFAIDNTGDTSNVDINDAKMTITNTGDVGIGTTSPSSPLHVRTGSSTTEDPIVSFSSGSGRSLNLLQPDNSDNNDPFTWFTNNSFQWRVDSNDIFTITGSSVGIGTTSPERLLHLAGNGVLRVDRESTEGGVIYLNRTSSDVLQGGIVLSGSDSGLNIAYDTDSTGGNTNLVQITSTGNVGIGTTTPSSPLHILTSQAGLSLAQTLQNSQGVGNQVGLAFRVAVGSNNVPKGAIAMDRDGGNGIGNMHFLLNNVSDTTTTVGMSDSRMTIMRTGNVGIGTTNPSNPLHIVSGDPDINLDFSVSPTADRSEIRFSNNGSLKARIEFDRNSEDFIINSDVDSNGNGDIILSGDNVGIGTDNPSYKLHVVGSAGKTTGSSWTSISDRRLKDIQGDYEYGLEEIMQLNTVRFNYSEGNELGLPSENKIVGFVAQEVQAVIPDAVHLREDGFLELNVDPIHWALLNATQEQQAIIESNLNMMETMSRGVENNSREIAALKAENETFKAQLQAIQAENLEMKAENQAIKKQLDAIKSLVCSLKPNAPSCRD